MARRPTRGRRTVAQSNTSPVKMTDKRGSYEGSGNPSIRARDQDIPIVKDGQPRETGRTGGMGHYQHSASSGLRSRPASPNKQAWDERRVGFSSPLKSNPSGISYGMGPAKPKAPRGGRKR